MLHPGQSRKRCAKAWRGFTLLVPWESDLELISKKAVLSCSQSVVQTHERLPITEDSLYCSCPVGREKFRSCHHALDGLPCPLVRRVARC